MTTTQSKNTPKPLPVATVDAISILKSDHKKVTDLFEKFDKIKESASSRERGDLVKTICSELLVHAAVEDLELQPH